MINYTPVIVILAFFLCGMQVSGPERSVPPETVRVIDDFQQDEAGGLPSRWRMRSEDRLVPLTPDYMRENEKFTIQREGDNVFVRAFSRDEAAHMYMGNTADGFDWDLNAFPVLTWDWRAHQLPVNAREDVERFNDSGGGIYVIFDIEGLLIRRPRTIKYVYSSTLPVGSVAKYGKLAVIVASSGLDGIGSWRSVRRNVVEDYRRVFGGTPERRPLSLRLWSDSDNMNSVGEVDFDNLVISSGDKIR